MFDDVQAASARIKGFAHRTPVVTSRTLNEQVGAEVYLKCENLQRVGAFKFRGAFNTISQLSEAEKARGVLTYSSGNHAQAVALACRLLGAPAIVVMPDNAPAIKRTATEGYGAQVIAYDPATQDRREVAEQLQREYGYTLVPPYDHPHVIAGQGTAALELVEDVGPLDALLVPCGGGGLLSGSAIAAKGLCPTCRVIGIEPELADDATRSFRTRTLHTVHNPPTIADGTRTPSLGVLTFPLVLRHVDDMQTVTEAAIITAVKFLFFRTKLVVEPSGALGVAALLSGVVRVTGRVGVILSGGNVDGETMTAILTG
jgi:threonine dehydratase